MAKRGRKKLVNTLIEKVHLKRLLAYGQLDKVALERMPMVDGWTLGFYFSSEPDKPLYMSTQRDVRGPRMFKSIDTAYKLCQELGVNRIIVEGDAVGLNH